ncbi:MAG: prepilin-type N-terminal cleavage/methylation domain-containing protein [Candidatus Omnitrophica bacterium]|nr:prepilin-type N-terminal cleavage/methylation domain-containing protein [Candidatus Omnitrophota bacterium]
MSIAERPELAQGSRLKAQGSSLQPSAFSLQLPRRRMALTLVELLVAMAIFVTVSASAALIFRSIAGAWRTGQLRTARYQQARLLIDLFERELSSCTANPKFPMVGAAAADAARLKPGSAQDEVFFAGTLPGRRGLVERGYWVDGAGRLMCHDDESGDATYATGEDEVCGREVAGLAIRYFDGAAWQPRWDARPQGPQAGRLPKALRITLTIGRRRPETFETVVHVPTS